MSALYVWEWSNYPQYYIPLADVRPGVLVDEEHEQKLSRGTARAARAAGGGVTGRGGARVYGDDALDGRGRDRRASTGPRWTPGSRRTSRSSSIPATPTAGSTRCAPPARSGSSSTASCWPSRRSPVMVFETGLPTRYYLNRTEVDFAHLVPTATVTACPYKGRTSGYWSVAAR